MGCLALAVGSETAPCELAGPRVSRRSWWAVWLWYLKMGKTTTTVDWMTMLRLDGEQWMAELIHSSIHRSIKVFPLMIRSLLILRVACYRCFVTPSDPFVCAVTLRDLPVFGPKMLESSTNSTDWCRQKYCGMSIFLSWPLVPFPRPFILFCARNLHFDKA